MCGITLYKSSYRPLVDVGHRGPTSSKVVVSKTGKYKMIFNRLSINDLSQNGDQPFMYEEGVYMMCNGEIYNHKELEVRYNVKPESGSDCEILLHLYVLLGFKKMVEELDGEFAIIILDERDVKKIKVYVARDPLGVRPMFYNSVGFCSEAKVLPRNDTYHVLPGQVYEFVNDELMKYEYNCVRQFPSVNLDCISESQMELINSKVRTLFRGGVEKRIKNSDRPIGLLLSGGFDSSLVASMVRVLCPHVKICTFSIGQSDSSDLMYARMVSEYIESEHHEVLYDGNEVIKRIPELIRMLETYDVTTIRASMPMYLLAEYISKNTDIKVVLSGEGSDEFGYYKYFEKAPSILEACKESRRLFEDIYMFDVLRADRSIAGNGLELRVPFLDLEFFRYMHTIPYEYHRPGMSPSGEFIEKCNLRRAFLGYLPDEVLWRKKDAFSDSVGVSWRETLIAFAERTIDEKNYEKYEKSVNPPLTKEALWYRMIYNKYYSDNLVSYYWMPKWVNGVIDPSAKVLI